MGMQAKEVRGRIDIAVTDSRDRQADHKSQMVVSGRMKQPRMLDAETEPEMDTFTA